MNMLKGSALLKLTALLVAVMTYYYIRNEIASQERSSAADASYKLIKLTAKVLPVKARLETAPPNGYRILEDEVTVSPSEVTVIGPEALLETSWTAETSIVDVSDNTKTVIKRLPIESVAGIHIAGQSTTVEVTVPIEKIPEPELPAPPAETP